MSRKGLWVHCGCGCGYTGRVVEEGGGEVSVKNGDEVRVYANDKVFDGAWCEVCYEKPAHVTFLFTHPLLGDAEMEEAMCFTCYSNAGTAVALRGVVIKSVKALTPQGQDGDSEPVTY